MTRMPVTVAADIKQEVLATINAHNKFWIWYKLKAERGLRLHESQSIWTSFTGS